MKREKFFFIGIAALSAVIIASIFFITFEAKHRLQNSLLQNYSKQEALIAQRVVHDFQLEVESIRQQLHFIASLPEVRFGSTASCNQVLKKATDLRLTRVNNLGRVGADGTFHCSLNPSLIGVRAETLGSYITTIFNDPEHTPVMSRTIKPPGAGYAVAIHVPVFDDEGKFIGTLGGALYYNRLQEQYLKDVVFADRGFVSLLDDDGTILYHQRSELIAKSLDSAEVKTIIGDATPFKQVIERARRGEEGSFRYTTAYQGEKIASFKPVEVLPGRRWIVVVTVPVEDAERELATIGVDRVLNLLALILVGITLLVALLFIYIVRKAVLEPMAKVDKAKTEFLSIASHQLRTPLGSMRWNLEMLQSEAEKLPPEARDQLQEVYKSNVRTIRLVGDLLNVSRIEQDRVKDEPMPTNVVEIIESALKEMKPEADKKSISLDLALKKTDIPQIVIDPKRWREVVQNLLSNAVRYTPSGGHIRVEVNATPRTIEFAIADNGIGIPENEQFKIFTKFSRAENAARVDTEGSGLGLYIVKAFVEGWGGEVWFESSVGIGTKFYISLPLKPKSGK